MPLAGDLFHFARIAVIDSQTIGAILQLAVRVSIRAVRVLRLHVVDGPILQRDDRIGSLYDGIVAGQPGPRSQPDARQVFTVDHLGGFDLHRLGVRPRRIPMQFRLAIQKQLAGAGIVGCANGLAIAVLELEGRRALGDGFAGVAVERDARGVDRNQGVLGLAFIRHGQRDIHRAIGVEPLLRLIVVGVRAVYQIVIVRMHGRHAQFDLLKIHVVGIFSLARVLGCNAADGAAFRRLGGFDPAPIEGRGTQLRSHRFGLGWSLVVQFPFLEPVGGCYASQQQDNGHQDEPARASHR